MGKKAYGYLRVSSKGQVDGDGLTRQESAILGYATAHGFEVIDIFREEGVSGAVEDRPVLAEMLISLAENGTGVKTVLVEKVDRLARDLMVQENIFRSLTEIGIDLVSAAEGNLTGLGEDPSRKLIRHVMGAIAEYDKSMTVAKLRAARNRIKRKTGKCEGRKSYSEAAPEILDEIKILRRKKRGQKRPTFEAVAKQLNEQGLKTVTGKPFSGPLVSGILHNNQKIKRIRLNATLQKDQA